MEKMDEGRLTKRIYKTDVGNLKRRDRPIRKCKYVVREFVEQRSLRGWQEAGVIRKLFYMGGGG